MVEARVEILGRLMDDLLKFEEVAPPPPPPALFPCLSPRPTRPIRCASPMSSMPSRLAMAGKRGIPRSQCETKSLLGRELPLRCFCAWLGLCVDGFRHDEDGMVVLVVG